jgi:hypothetical protein
MLTSTLIPKYNSSTATTTVLVPPSLSAYGESTRRVREILQLECSSDEIRGGGPGVVITALLLL